MAWVYDALYHLQHRCLLKGTPLRMGSIYANVVPTLRPLLRISPLSSTIASGLRALRSVRLSEFHGRSVSDVNGGIATLSAECRAVLEVMETSPNDVPLLTEALTSLATFPHVGGKAESFLGVLAFAGVGGLRRLAVGDTRPGSYVSNMVASLIITHWDCLSIAWIGPAAVSNLLTIVTDAYPDVGPAKLHELVPVATVSVALHGLIACGSCLGDVAAQICSTSLADSSLQNARRALVSVHSTYYWRRDILAHDAIPAATNLLAVFGSRAAASEGSLVDEIGLIMSCFKRLVSSRRSITSLAAAHTLPLFLQYIRSFGEHLDDRCFTIVPAMASMMCGAPCRAQATDLQRAPRPATGLSAPAYNAG